MFALTFDDGPSYTGTTKQILDVLLANKVKATFFVVGTMITSTTEPLIRREYAEGHRVMIHDTDHTSFLGMTADQVYQRMEIMKTRISGLIGRVPRYMRCPYGEYDATTLQGLAKAGLSHIDWTYDSSDWELQDTTAILSQLDSYFASNKASSAAPISIFHDIHQFTADAVQGVIDRVLKNGFRFVLMDECLNDKDGAYVA